MNKMIAYCGLICTDCSAYRSTQNNDSKAKEVEIVKWQEMFNRANIDIKVDADFITCDGCLSSEGQLCGHCAACDIRTCCIEKSVNNCGYCKEYPCKKIVKIHDEFSKTFNIKDFFGYYYNPRDVLDKINNSNNVNK